MRRRRTPITVVLAAALLTSLFGAPISPAAAAEGVAFEAADDLDPSPGNGFEILNKPTSMDWGPDQRLYVSEQFGLIRIFDVTRSAGGDFSATEAADSPIALVRDDIPNHNDDGALFVGAGSSR
ncbi:MAG TPA: hypothetical protein VJ938_00550, partial [Acidimicrobiia bacterium]|nr:hypothetical protein [Acidimicrobiia bacterium]